MRKGQADSKVEEISLEAPEEMGHSEKMIYRKDQDVNTIYEQLGLMQHLFESNVEYKMHRPERN